MYSVHKQEHQKTINTKKIAAEMKVQKEIERSEK